MFYTLYMFYSNIYITICNKNDNVINHLMWIIIIMNINIKYILWLKIA